MGIGKKALFNLMKPLSYGDVTKRGTFQMCLAPPRYRSGTDDRYARAACEKFVRPLLSISDIAYVYGLNDKPEMLAHCAEILKSEKGKHRILKEKECLAGYEKLYISSGGARGTMLFGVDARNTEQLVSLFRFCYNPAYCRNPAAGQTASAMKFAKKKSKDEEFTFILLPRNNGIEYCDIVSSPERALNLFKSAHWKCSFPWY